MKKLNKNGFTLVELLAVIVILALLIVIVANTAIPAMNNAKKKSLQTYAEKVVQKAKENCAAEKMADMGFMCNSDTGDTKVTCCGSLSIKQIMGEDNGVYTGTVTTNYANGVAAISTVSITDNSGNTASYSGGKITVSEK